MKGEKEKNMKILKDKTKAATISFILMLSIAVTLVALPAATAQAERTKKTYAYLGAIPNPVGKGQTVLLHVGITDYLLMQADGFTGLWVSIKKPDNTTDTISNIRTDSTGGTSRVFIPDQVGTYTLQTHFPEQVYNWTSPPIFDPTVIGPVRYLASVSDELKLVVQAEPIEYYPGVPLPTEYWTRPIDKELREWSTIAGSWFETPPNQFAPYNDGPETAHILWTKPLIAGGLSGADINSATIADHGHDEGDAYRGRFQNPVIIEGILFYLRYGIGFFGSLGPSEVVAVDLHTGKELWVRNNTGLSFGQTMRWDSPNMHATFSYLWETVGSTWNAYDPLHGEWVYTMTNVPSGTRVRGPDGEILIYTVDLQNGWMTCWNSSNVPALRGLPAFVGPFGFVYFSWLPEQKTVDAVAPCPYSHKTPLNLSGYMWNVTIQKGTKSLPGSISYTLQDRIIGGNIAIGELGLTAPSPIVFWGINTAPGKEGQLLFNTTWTPPPDVVIGQVCASLEDKVFVLWQKETRQHYGFSLDTGAKLWGPSDPQYYLDAIEDTPQNARIIAYHKLYVASVSGIAYCYDVKNGTLLWKYEANDPYQEIFWSNNWWLRTLFITDGKLYVGHGEHSARDPMPRGAPFICLDATTGKVIFRADSLFRQTRWGGRAIIGDSIIATMDTYDERVYAVGKGPSATTVSIQSDVITKGSSAVIKGMVTDVSPGAQEFALTARFPNGVPAIADENMSEWMLYVYKQFPLPGNLVGVPVTLDAVNPDGTWTHIGTVTGDSSGLFSYMWTPPSEGAYKIVATFPGSKSYYASYAQTALGVTAAPPVPTPAPTKDEVAKEVVSQLPAYPDYTALFAGIIIAVVVAIILVVYDIITVRKLRK